MKPIGVFDSGYGGLTVLKELVNLLPGYDYYYLGDNARAPYGPRSFDTVYEYTLQAVKWFFAQGCPLVILACNTASAKALRSIQQNDLPAMGSEKRVLGVIRPTAEVIGDFTQSGHIGLFGTEGTVQSGSYVLEIQKTFPQLSVTQEACPLWVPLVENNEHHLPGSDYFIRKHVKHLLEQDPQIDTILLACTHYPLLEPSIRKFLPEGIKLISQGEITARALQEYLKRHSAMEAALSKGGGRHFFTTGHPGDFNEKATLFYEQPVKAQKISLI
jgi:glutamate racemase